MSSGVRVPHYPQPKSFAFWNFQFPIFNFQVNHKSQIQNYKSQINYDDQNPKSQTNKFQIIQKIILHFTLSFYILIFTF